MYRVLLVEDDSQIRQVIGDYFGRRDQIALDFAEDGNIGLSKFLNGSYDLIVLDIMMPGIDGFELCKLIRKKTDIPVVFLTGKVREQDALYGYEIGADDYIVKPFSIAVLYSKLLAMLERTTTEHESRKIIESGKIAVDPVKFEVTVSGEIVDLPRISFFQFLNRAGAVHPVIQKHHRVTDGQHSEGNLHILIVFKALGREDSRVHHRESGHIQQGFRASKLGLVLFIAGNLPADEYPLVRAVRLKQTVNH